MRIALARRCAARLRTGCRRGDRRDAVRAGFRARRDVPAHDGRRRRPRALESRGADLFAAGEAGTVRQERVPLGRLGDCAQVAAAPGGPTVAAAALPRPRHPRRGARARRPAFGPVTTLSTRRATRSRPGGGRLALGTRGRGLDRGRRAVHQPDVAGQARRVAASSRRRVRPRRGAHAVAAGERVGPAERCGGDRRCRPRDDRVGAVRCSSPERAAIEIASAEPGGAFTVHRLARRTDRSDPGRAGRGAGRLGPAGA